MWERFEDRKINSSDAFVVTLVGCDPKYRQAYLGFNQEIRTQLIGKNMWLDVFIDRPRKLIGLRFLGEPTDIHSYKIGKYNSTKTQARISATGFLKAWGLLDQLGRRSYRVELKGDRMEQMWWFDISKLMGKNGSSQ